MEVIRGFIDLLYSGFAVNKYYDIIKVLTSLIHVLLQLIKMIKHEEFTL